MSARLVRRSSVLAAAVLTSALSLLLLGPSDASAPAAVSAALPFLRALLRS